MHIAIKFDYNALSSAAEKSAKLIEWLPERFPSAFRVVPATDDNPTHVERQWSTTEYIVTTEELEELLFHKVQCTIARFKGSNDKSKVIDGGVHNAAIHYHLPNFDLHSFNKVIWEDDCCTETLQERLDDGWRIIAVCPPLSARRPDYILGKRTND